MNKHPGFFEEEIHAFIDGELDPARRAEIEELVKEDGELARRIAAFQSDKETLQAMFSGVAETPVPQSWLKRIEQATEKKQVPAAPIPFPRRGQAGSRAWLPRNIFSQKHISALAASMMLVIGSSLTYEHFAVPSEEAIIAEAIDARAETMRPQAIVAANAIANREQSDRVIDTALDMKLKTPDLGKFGFQLTAMRVYSDVPGGKAVELDYHDTQNRLFTVYMRKPSSAARVDMINRNGMWTCIWQDDVLGTVMQGEMSAAEMARLASTAYNGLYL